MTETGLDLSACFSADGGLDDLIAGDALVYPTDTVGELIFFGDPAAAHKHGEVVASVPRDLARVAVGVDALVKAGLAMSEQAGLLVRLTPESTRRLRELQTIKDASGAALGVLRGTDGTFTHVIRFQPAQMLQTASSVTGALSAIATQAQLARIEKAIGAVSQQVDALGRSAERDREADGEAIRGVILEVYRAAQSTGTLTRAMWDQLAPVNKDVRRLQARSALEAKALRQELEELRKKPVKDRRTRLGELESGELQAVFDDLQRDNRALVQFQALRLWHLTVAGDAGLEAYVFELRAAITEQAELIAGLYNAIEDAVEAAGGSSRFQNIFSPLNSRWVKDRTGKLLEQLGEMRAGYRPTQLGVDGVQQALLPVPSQYT
ncbi:hypothetical protein [Modestobacter marinus]|uniref:hypothetical protein n=1 Tax=Modestobacter marinus TaxID=477641 RepID=UPI001C9631E3|nr:hypothetical protein [Modestobacter marinus]